MNYSEATNNLLSPNIEEALASSDAMMQAGMDAPLAVEKCFSTTQGMFDEENLLVFCYAGLSVFESSLSFATKIHTKIAHAKVCLVTVNNPAKNAH